MINISMPPKIYDIRKGLGDCPMDTLRGHHYTFSAPEEFLNSDEYKSGKITSYEPECLCGKKWSE